jgi:hypothetical protein
MNYGKSMISLLHYLFYGYRTCCQPKIPSFYGNNIYGTSYNLEDRIFSFLKWCRQKDTVLLQSPEVRLAFTV